MAGYVSCCVPNCEDRHSTRHRFPNPNKDENRFAEWIRLVCNPKLFDMDPLRVYNNYRVCHKHFRVEDKLTNMYLKRTTVPFQNLPVQHGN